MRKYSARSLESLRGIHPDLRRVIDRALQDSPLDFIVIEGVRSKERQSQLMASGASKTMNSRHLTGHAVDLLPIGLDGRPAFDWPLYDQLGPAVEAAARAEGVKITWGGRWSKFKDGPHFELDRDTYPASEWITGQPAPEPRTSPTQSNTIRASAATVAGAAGTATAALSGLDEIAQYIILGFVGVIALCALFIMRERLKAWGSGWR
jgi:peptidoglycan L-alanyl-D-glutamate endopeptidase CwlK